MALGAIQENLQPSSTKNLYQGNYIDFTDSSFDQWGQQFLPDIYEKESEIYGNRTIGGFLKMVSAEMPMSSDQVIWTEQGRLHVRLASLSGGVSAITAVAASSVAVAANSNGGQSLSFVFDAVTNDGYEAGVNIPFRVGQTVMVGKENSSDEAIKGVITAISAFGFTITTYVGHVAIAASDSFTALVYGNEFAKGTGNFDTKIDPQYSTYDNAPIIMKEQYSLYGSDATQIGWIEVTSENGASGYLWYVKAEHENRLRWEDQLEMTMLEAVKQDGTGATLGSFRDDNNGVGGPASGDRAARGTEGFFAALDDRGNQYDGLTDDLAVGGRNGLAAFDNILKTLDKNGAIEENMIYCNRDLALEFDNLLASQSDFTQNGGGASWGVFNNSSSMALDLGFTGFKRGSYDFYKSDWKYLNDFATRGGFGDIEGVMIPAGTSTVYDQTLGKNIKRPFLHVRYRASETENRKMKSWITGSVGGAYTTDIDELRLHYLTERCLVTQGANNFFKFNG